MCLLFIFTHNKNIKGLAHTDGKNCLQKIKSLIDSYQKNGGSLQDATFCIYASTQKKLKSFDCQLLLYLLEKD